MSNILANPNGAHRTVTDFREGVDADGNEIIFGNQTVESWQAAGTILKGQALMLVAPTATAPPTVTPMTAAVTAGDSWRFVGAALESAKAGEQVRVCTAGICLVLHDASDDPSEYDLVSAPATTTGDFDVVAGAAVDNGVYVGYFLGPTIAPAATTDLALAMIGQPLVRFEAGA
jgi:hypothetical protein